MLRLSALLQQQVDTTTAGENRKNERKWSSENTVACMNTARMKTFMDQAKTNNRLNNTTV